VGFFKNPYPEPGKKPTPPQIAKPGKQMGKKAKNGFFKKPKKPLPRTGKKTNTPTKNKTQ
jgi:hypothetical protein